MYHLLVTGNPGAWDLPVYEYNNGRFCEYTSNWIKDKYSKPTAADIEELKSCPALFAYEGKDAKVRVGYIRHVKIRGTSAQAEYEFEQDIPEFTFSAIAHLKTQLHIQDDEMYRTHWAIKEKNLLQVLSSAGLIDESFANSSGKPGRVGEMCFKVALSFPGERREYVKAIADELKKRLPPGSVFYDKDFTAQLAMPNLDTVLQRIYLKNSDLIVVFLCADYEEKQWCGVEWRAIRNIIKNKGDHSVMFMRFDDADVEGVFSIDGYVELRECTPLDAARLIVQRIRLNDKDLEAIEAN